ncbi:hypothetical protein PANT111_100121 [Pantoea brenneri]|uniref:Uncharacterized protein n=1 Tax=Pantoea brenneri TaxID=472694 RepID=A0AAX3J0D8_9GAMM|nr:hypothetical protein PANT111_100121 [Pantoea brenneri]
MFPEQSRFQRQAGFREHTPSAKTQKTPSLARYALLQAYVPFALRPEPYQAARDWL